MSRWLIFTLLGVGIAVAVWLGERTENEAPSTEAAGSEAQAENPQAAVPPAEMPSDEPISPVAPDYRIAENGRLSIEAASFQDKGVLAFGLALPDEARGDATLPARLISLDGRRLDITATPVSGAGSGVRLEVPAEALLPGRYMIEISTAEKRPLALRRYVLEVE